MGFVDMYLRLQITAQWFSPLKERLRVFSEEQDQPPRRTS